MKKYDIIGTYRKRGIKNNMFGLIDNKFRIIDLRDEQICERKSKESDSEDIDKRKNISGREIKTIKRDCLKNIAEHLNTGVSQKSIMSYDKEQLCTLIEKFLINKNRVMK